MRFKCYVNGEVFLNIIWLKDGSILSREDEKLLKFKGRVLNFYKLFFFLGWVIYVYSDKCIWYYC